MAINNVAEERAHHVSEFLGHDFVSGLRTLKTEEAFKKLKT